MFARLVRHVRQQFVGYLALFIALGGVSYAAVTLPRNSVGSKQIKRGAVKNSDLGRSAVTGSKVKNGSLQATDFRSGQLPTGPQGPQGATGATGQGGPKGEPGAAGSNGATNVTIARADMTVIAGQSNATTVQCPAGQRATGGGVGSATGGASDRIIQSGPVDTDLNFTTLTTGEVPTGWSGKYFNGQPNGQVAYVYAICAAP